MSGSRKDLPPPAAGDVLSRRFSIAADAPAAAPPAPPPTPHTAHTRSSPTKAEPPAERRGEPDGMVRRTYYYSERVADALAEAVDRIHYDSRGRIPKHVALDAIIEAGVGQVDAIARRLLGRA